MTTHTSPRSCLACRNAVVVGSGTMGPRVQCRFGYWPAQSLHRLTQRPMTEYALECADFTAAATVKVT